MPCLFACQQDVIFKSPQGDSVRSITTDSNWTSLRAARHERTRVGVDDRSGKTIANRLLSHQLVRTGAFLHEASSDRFLGRWSEHHRCIVTGASAQTDTRMCPIGLYVSRFPVVSGTVPSEERFSVRSSLPVSTLRWATPTRVSDTANCVRSMHPLSFSHLLVGGAKGDASYDGCGHFFAAAAEAMRRLLVERSRCYQLHSHGGGWNHEQITALPADLPPITQRTQTIRHPKPHEKALPC